MCMRSLDVLCVVMHTQTLMHTQTHAHAYRERDRETESTSTWAPATHGDRWGRWRRTEEAEAGG